ncbi:MAG TPA: ATP-binding protein [Polyangiaceae bacterium]
MPKFEHGAFRRFVDGLRDCVAIDEEGVLTYLNPKFLEHLGLESETSALGRSMSELLECELLGNELAQLRSAIDSARTRADGAVTELRLAFSRAGERVYEVSIHTQQPQSGTVLVFTLKEVLTAHGVRAALEHTDRLASLGTLAAGVAHEVNNPLAYVVSNLGYSIEQIIRMRSQLGGVPLPAQVREEFADNLTRICEALEEAGEGTDRVARIVQGLKSFSRSEGESRGPVNLQEVLNSAVNMAENEIRYRAQLERAFGETPLVFGNEARLVQVFVNLLVNAAQAIPEGNPQSHCIRVSTHVAESGRVVAEVSDTGVGIPSEMVDRIFDPFFTTKPIGVGTGLGLSICHGLIHGLGGNISVVSEERRGTTFRVELLPAEPEVRRTTISDRPSASRGELLIIDDEPLVLRAFRRTLASQHNILTVNDAAKALHMIEQGQAFDLIFCDLMMPGMTGMDFHALLRQADPELAERVVFLTGGAFTSSAREYLNSVPNRALEKPLHPRALRSFVSKALA